MTRFCEQCGAKLEAGENFCPSCGAKITRDEPPKPKAPPPSTSPSTSPKNTTEKSSDHFTKFGIVTLILLIFLGVIYQYQKSQEKKSWTYSPPTSSSESPTASSEPRKQIPAALNESDLEIGNIALSLSKTYLDEQFGAGKVQSDGWYDYGNFWVKFDSDYKVYWVSCMSANLNTPRGIHVGSTLTEIAKAYDIDKFRKETNDKTVNYECDLRGMTLIFSLLQNSDKVDEIVLVQRNRAPQNPPPAENPKPPAENPKPPAENPKPPAEKPKPPAEKPRVPDEYNYSCTVNGEKAYKGISRRGVACALYSVEKQKRITSDFGSNYTARGTFYIVTVIVGNFTNEPIFVPSIYLMDERGRKFSSNTGATSTYTVMHNVESAFQLNPGQPDWIYEVFDIPDDANITSLRCEASFSLEDNNFNVPLRVVTE
ncbi:MAG: zinc ribbon domain-containing protein [Selenomonadaceae bacterium]|nr:zinc ribbon domain-containing protein [Selenomonadaceae bacterium]